MWIKKNRIHVQVLPNVIRKVWNGNIYTEYLGCLVNTAGKRGTKRVHVQYIRSNNLTDKAA